MEQENKFEEFEKSKLKLAQKRFRILAFIIDFFIFWSIGFIAGYLFEKPLNDEFGYNLSGLPAFIVMLIGIFLWPVSEGVFGQTIGKRIFNIKVVNEDYSSISISKGFLRSIFSFIDSIFCLGIIIAFVNKNNKRIGDLVARTIVVESN